MTEIPGTPKRPGWICWQIRWERQPDGSLKMRREYMTAPAKGLTPATAPPEMAVAPEPTTCRGVAAQTQRNLL